MTKKALWFVAAAIFFIMVSFLIRNDFVIITMTKGGIVFGQLAYEKRSIPVSETDLAIVREAKFLITNPQHWSKNDGRSCNGRIPFTLFCSLLMASNKIGGKYIHRRPALQEVRFAIDDLFHNRWKAHRLADFNSHMDTRHSDVLAVLNLAIKRIEAKLKK